MKYLFALLLILLPAVAGAQPIQDIPLGEDLIVPVKEGEVAPFTGQLFETNTAMRWANYLLQYKYRLALDVEEQKKVCAVRTGALRDELIIERTKYGRTVQSYEERVRTLIEERDNPPFYETAWFGVILGVVGATAVTAVVTWAATSRD